MSASADASEVLRPGALGEGLLVGVVAALVWSGAATALGGWASLADFGQQLGVATLVGASMIAFGRLARPRLSDAGPAWIGVAVAAAPLAILGSLLEAKTHHRPVGGVTFALVAMGLVVGSVWLASRLDAVARARRWARIQRAMVAIAVVSVVFALYRLSSIGGALAGAAGLGALGIVIVALAIAWRGRLPAAAAKAGPPVWIVVSVLALL